MKRIVYWGLWDSYRCTFKQDEMGRRRAYATRANAQAEIDRDICNWMAKRFEANADEIPGGKEQTK